MACVNSSSFVTSALIIAAIPPAFSISSFIASAASAPLL
jgi:hypothetical protein